MKSIDFNFLLTNAAFPASVLLTPTTLSIELRDLQCDFPIIQSFTQSSQYTTTSQSSSLTYSKHSQKLLLSFSLKEISTQGRCQVHELPNLIERQINALIFHCKLLSNLLDPVIASLAEYGLRIKHLVHDSSIVSIPTKNYGEKEVKTYIKNNNILAMTSELLTPRLFEHYFEMQKPLNLNEVFEQLAISAEFQVILNEVLGFLANQAHKVYVSGSYAYAGCVCTANAYNEVHICYMKDIVIKVKVSSFPYTLEVVDMSFYNSSLTRIRRFEGCLHHAASRALKDPSLAGLKNTVNTDKDADICQTLELHKPEHVKNTLILMVNYSQLIYLFEKVKNTVDDTVKTMKYIYTVPLFSYHMLDLKVELAGIQELRFNFTMKMKPNNIELDPDIDIESVARRENELERLEKWKKILILYFRNCIKDYCKGNPEVLIGFAKIFLVSPAIMGEFMDILKEELETKGMVEMIWPFFVLKEDSYRFTVKVWNVCGKSTDVVFAIKYNKDVETEISTNLDPNFVNQFLSQKGGNPVDVLRVAMSKRADEIRTKQIND